MQTAVEYRKYAQECIESARHASSDAVRIQFLELAKLWLAAATQLELRKKRRRQDDLVGIRPTRSTLIGIDRGARR